MIVSGVAVGGGEGRGRRATTVGRERRGGLTVGGLESYPAPELEARLPLGGPDIRVLREKDAQVRFEKTFQSHTRSITYTEHCATVKFRLGVHPP